jgi:hypothetical protein
MQQHRLIVSFVHGNAVGLILEPSDTDTTLPEQERARTWAVRIGPLSSEVAIGTEYPKAEFQAVINDLVAFLQTHDLPGMLEVFERYGHY